MIFNDLYNDLLKRAIESNPEKNNRTGRQVHIIPHAVSFLINQETLPLPFTRKYFPISSAAEVAWFLMGTKDITWLKRNTSMWNNFVEEDGITIENSYGYRWRKSFDRDQIILAIQTLKNDPSSRQVYISAWDPRKDGLGNPAKNIPCPVGFNLSIINNQLHSSIFLRSSDIFVGLPYDVMGHYLLVSAFAQSLNIKLGTIHFTLAHAHLYDVHLEYAKKCLTNKPIEVNVKVPDYSIQDIIEFPDSYLSSMRRLLKFVPMSDYKVVPEVVK